MGSLARFVGVVALGLALGTIVVGHGVVLPMLDAQTGLIDPNLARALAQPMALRLAELLALCCVLLALAAPHWLRSRFATTTSLLLVGAAAVNRAVIVPTLYATWSHVDLVAGRPAARIAAAQELARDHQWVLLAMAAGLLVTAGIAARRGGSEAPTRLETDEAQATAPAAVNRQAA